MTTTGGLANGSPSPSAWKQVATFEHSHGSSQFFNAGGGVVYAPGSGGVYRSTDFGATWTKVVTTNFENGVFGTSKFIYSDFGGATTIGNDQTGHLWQSPRNPGTNWTNYYMKPPSGMTNGSDHATVTSDGTHNIIVSGNWDAGFWRYVEP
jgi:hypothetical protein